MDCLRHLQLWKKPYAGTVRARPRWVPPPWVSVAVVSSTGGQSRLWRLGQAVDRLRHLQPLVPQGLCGRDPDGVCNIVLSL